MEFKREGNIQNNFFLKKLISYNLEDRKLFSRERNEPP